MKTRPLEMNEYNEIKKHILTGFTYGDNKVFRSNPRLALILTLQANLGLRIGDVLELTFSKFKNSKFETIEQKTGKLQYRDVNPELLNTIMEYVLDNKLSKDDKLFTITVRSIQKQLKIVCDYLGYNNISTHSFRKLYATNQYKMNDNDIELVKELLNHSSIAVTQKYIKVSQSKINEASRNYYIG